jgi:hypothetical protein
MVTLAGLPEGVIAPSQTIAADRNATTLELLALSNAAVGSADVRLLLTCGERLTSGVLPLTIEPGRPAEPLQLAMRGWPDLNSVPPTQAPAAWRQPGMVAALSGKGNLIYPRLPGSSFALDVELELPKPGSQIVFHLGDLPDRWLAEVTIDRDEVTERLRCRAIRRNGGQWFSPGPRWLPERQRLRLALVVVQEWTMVFLDGERVSQTPAGPNLRVRIESPSAKTAGMLHWLTCRPVTDREKAEIAVLPPRTD